MCGGLGEPTLYKDIFKLLPYFKKHNPNIRLNISSNGSTRDPNWWEELAKILDDKDDVTFGIDGIDEIHNIHRTSDYRTILRNMEAFIEAGGVAHWQTIVFKHNQHQIEEMGRIANAMGATYEPKMSGFYDKGFEKPTIDVGARPSFIYKTRRKTEDLNFEEEEKCDLIYGRPFISVKGYFLPCPFLRTYDEFSEHQMLTDPKFFIKFYQYEKDLNIANNTFEEIIKSPFFDWVNANRINLSTCIKYCGACNIK